MSIPVDLRANFRFLRLMTVFLPAIAVLACVPQAQATPTYISPTPIVRPTETIVPPTLVKSEKQAIAQKADIEKIQKLLGISGNLDEATVQNLIFNINLPIDPNFSVAYTDIYGNARTISIDQSDGQPIFEGDLPISDVNEGVYMEYKEDASTYADILGEVHVGIYGNENAISTYKDFTSDPVKRQQIEAAFQQYFRYSPAKNKAIHLVFHKNGQINVNSFGTADMEPIDIYGDPFSEGIRGATTIGDGNTKGKLNTDGTVDAEFLRNHVVFFIPGMGISAQLTGTSFTQSAHGTFGNEFPHVGNRSPSGLKKRLQYFRNDDDAFNFAVEARSTATDFAATFIPQKMLPAMFGSYEHGQAVTGLFASMNEAAKR